MIALLLMATAFAGDPSFETAFATASDAVGTPEFAAALADVQCTGEIPGCAKRVAGLRKLDREQRAYVASHSPGAEDVPAHSQQTASVATEAVMEPPPLMAFMPAVVPDVRGVNHVGGYSDLGDPWRGVEVMGIKHDWPDAVVVCAMKGNAPVHGFGRDVPIADSSAPGTPVRYCPAARVTEGSIFVPSGTTLEIARSDPSGVYIVMSVYKCDVSSYHTGRVQSKGARACSAIRQ